MDIFVSTWRPKSGYKTLKLIFLVGSSTAGPWPSTGLQRLAQWAVPPVSPRLEAGGLEALGPGMTQLCRRSPAARLYLSQFSLQRGRTAEAQPGSWAAPVYFVLASRPGPRLHSSPCSRGELRWCSPATLMQEFQLKLYRRILPGHGKLFPTKPHHGPQNVEDNYPRCHDLAPFITQHKSWLLREICKKSQLIFGSGMDWPRFFPYPHTGSWMYWNKLWFSIGVFWKLCSFIIQEWKKLELLS